MRNYIDLLWGITVLWLLVGALAGCAKRPDIERQVLADDDSQFLLTVVVDLSSSCAPIMAEDGAAFKFTMALIDKYFRSRIGSHDRLIVAQISANGRPLLWEGEPLALRQQFRSAAQFAQFLRDKSDDSGSRVYTGVTRTLEYALSRHGGGAKKSATFILSDMRDHSDSSKADARKMLSTVADYCQAGGSIAFYFVEQTVARYLKQHLEELGVTNYRIETEIVGMPPLPHLE